MCDAFVAVSPDRVIFASNSNRDPNEAQVLGWIGAREHAAHSTLHCTWRAIPQVRRTHALVLSRPFWMWGAEMGANEHGVAIGNAAVFARGALEADGLPGADLVRLGLERGASAAEAVEVIAALLAAHGQGGRAEDAQAGAGCHNSFLVADRREAWLLETAGRESARERIASGERAISGTLALPALTPRSRRLQAWITGSAARRARVATLAAGAGDAAAAAAVLSDHGDAAPRYTRCSGALHAPCVHAGGWLAASQTTASWISELADSGDRHWATGTAAPCLGLFRPLALRRVRNGGRPTGSPDLDSLWWRFERLHRHVLRDPGALPPSFHADRARTQRAIFDDPVAGWDIAEDWLARWEALAATPRADSRPRWLRRYWKRIETQAAQGSALPWREAA
jgi:hypothetical protein